MAHLSRRFLLFGISVLFGLLSLEPLSYAETFSGKVVGVTDGDTIKVMRDGKAVKVRLAGIDCPEKKQPYGTRAKQFTSDQVFGKKVDVRVEKTDMYGRLIGWVYLPDGTNVNHEVLVVGMAWWYRKYYPEDQTLEDLEAKARAAKYGLWKDEHPIPPWEWRRQRRR